MALVVTGNKDSLPTLFAFIGPVLASLVAFTFEMTRRQIQAEARAQDERQAAAASVLSATVEEEHAHSRRAIRAVAEQVSSEADSMKAAAEGIEVIHKIVNDRTDRMVAESKAQREMIDDLRRQIAEKK